MIRVLKEDVAAGAQFQVTKTPTGKVRSFHQKYTVEASPQGRTPIEEAVFQVQQITNGAKRVEELPIFAKNLMPSQEKIFEVDGPPHLWDAARSSGH